MRIFLSFLVGIYCLLILGCHGVPFDNNILAALGKKVIGVSKSEQNREVSEQKRKVCMETGLHSQMDVIGIRLGEADCSPDVMQMRGGRFIVSPYLPGGDWIQHVLSSRHSGQSVEDNLNSAYAISAQRPRQVDSTSYYTIIFKYAGLTVYFEVRNGEFDAPKFMITEIKRAVCSADSGVLNQGSALYTALSSKYGKPSLALSYRDYISIARKEVGKLEELRQLLLQEPNANERDVARLLSQGPVPEMLGRFGSFNAMVRSQPMAIKGISWIFEDKTTFAAEREDTRTCQNGYIAVTTRFEAKSDEKNDFFAKHRAKVAAALRAAPEKKGPIPKF
jgi:hypothetical protein